MTLQRAIDLPRPGQACYRQAVPVEGWVYVGDRQSQLRRIRVLGPGGEIGATEIVHPRADVAQALGLTPDLPLGFRLLGVMRATQPPGRCPLEIEAGFADGGTEVLARIEIDILPNDYTSAPFGDLCNPQRVGLLHREHLYSSGYPSPTASPECVQLLAEYLPPARTVFDVGCGIGAYCDPLRARGFDWTGCETSRECVRQLTVAGRPHRPMPRRLTPWSRYRLPARDGEFDAAIAIEVLEHVQDPQPFLREISRVARQRVLFSVPNLETLPFLSDRLVAPWHLLEGDHRNFFSRFNLGPLLRAHFRRVELLGYGRQPLTSPEGVPLPYHLFAICER